MQEINSLENPIIKKYLKLKDKKFRDLDNLFLVYGLKQLNEISDKTLIKDIISTDEKIATIKVNEKIIKAFAQTITPIDPIIVMKKNHTFNYDNKILILDNIQNPDNLGAIIRSMVSFNITSLIMSNNSVDIYNDKVIRASQGGLFYITHKRTNLLDEIKKLKDDGYLILGTFPYNNIDCSFDIFNNKKIALIIGNEGNGISSELVAYIDKKISIKTYNLESLNAAVASSIVLYEWSKYAS